MWVPIVIILIIFGGLVAWFPHSPMVNDIKTIYGFDDERQNAINYLLANRYTIPEYETKKLMEKYDIKDSELDLYKYISANDTEPKLSTGAQIIKDNPILKFLLGY